MTMRASAALAEKLQTSLHFARLREPCSVEVNIRTKLFAQSTEVANSVDEQKQRLRKPISTTITKNENENADENYHPEGLLTVNFVEVATLGRACKQSLLSLNRNFDRCPLSF